MTYFNYYSRDLSINLSLPIPIPYSLHHSIVDYVWITFDFTLKVVLYYNMAFFWFYYKV